MPNGYKFPEFSREFAIIEAIYAFLSYKVFANIVSWFKYLRARLA